MLKAKKITAINSKGERIELEVTQLIICSQDGGELEIDFTGFNNADLHILAPSNREKRCYRQIEIYPGASNQLAIKVKSIKANVAE